MRPLFPLLTALAAPSVFAAESLWPDLSEPPRVGGSAQDAAVVVAIEDYSLVSDIPGARSNGLDWYSYLTDRKATKWVGNMMGHPPPKRTLAVMSLGL